MRKSNIIRSNRDNRSKRVFRRPDCFACVGNNGYCNALTGNPSCVGCNFFKTHEENEAQQAKCAERLERLGYVSTAMGYVKLRRAQV